MPRSIEDLGHHGGQAASVPGSLRKAAGGSATACLLALLAFGLGSGPETRPAPYPEGPPPGHTGGFGDPTCHACHGDHPLDERGGSLDLAGLPEAYGPGRTYRVEARLRREEMKRAGFQVTARFLQGDSAGRPAGSLATSRPGTRRIVDPETGIPYVQQTRAGSEPGPGSGEARWSFLWTAPHRGAGPVVFHAAANAGNDDASEFGDRVYTDSVVVAEEVRGAPPG